MRFGEGLKQERERRGISLDDVSVSTRVALRHLYALESDRFTELPGGIFNRGIVRSYAEFCGLDANGVLERFGAALRASGIDTEVHDEALVEFAEAVKRSRQADLPPRRLRWAGVALMLLAVILLALSVVWLLADKGVVHLPPKADRMMQRLVHRGQQQHQ